MEKLCTVPPELFFETSQFVIAAAGFMDAGHYQEWLTLFADDGVYAVFTAHNYANTGMALIYDDGIEARRERAAYLIGIWQTRRARMTRLVSNIQVRQEADAIHATSKFAYYRTDEDGLTRLHATGRTEDRLTRVEQQLQIVSRFVILDLETLPERFTELL